MISCDKADVELVYNIAMLSSVHITDITQLTMERHSCLKVRYNDIA